MMKKLILLLVIFMLFQACKKESNQDLKAKLDFLKVGSGEKTSYYVKVSLINDSNIGYYLSEFRKVFPLLIRDGKGKDCKKIYLRQEAFELTERTNDSLYKNFTYDTLETSQVIESAIEKQFVKQKIIYLGHRRDSIFDLALKSSLRGLYKDILLLNPKDSIDFYFRINSLVKKDVKYTIAFDYKNLKHIPFYFGNIFSYEHIEGRNDSYFVIYFPHFLRKIDMYNLYKKRIRSNLIHIN